MNRKEMQPQSLYRNIIDSLSAQIAILNDSGVIIATNKSWQEFGEANNLQPPVDSKGQNYLEVCDRSGDEAGELTAIGIRKVLSGKLQAFNMQYPCHSPTEERWFVVRVVKLKATGVPQVVVSHENITPVISAHEDLKKKEMELSQQKKMLEDSNIALKVLLEHREQDRVRLEENVLVNVRKLVRPYLEKLRLQKLNEHNLNLVEIIESRLEELTSPFLNRLTAIHRFLTPREIDVAALVREGRTSKEIAGLLNLSVSGVDFHRKMIRKKLGLSNEKSNLRSYLLSLH
jgi:DNA-binding CsgD family transcriptional regulator